MTFYQAKYKFNDTYINFKLYEEKKEIWIEDYYIDFNNIKIFFMLLRNSIDKFINDKYVTFVQTILSNDWNMICHLKWKIRSNNVYTNIIECDINNAIENIVNGLGILD